MKHNTLRGKLAAAATFVFVALFASGDAFGQGRYAAQYNKANVGAIITRLETSSNAFKTNFDRELDRSRLNNATKRQYRTTVSRYESSLNTLRRDFNRQSNWWNVRNRVQTVMTNARQVETLMNNADFRRNVEQQWNRMRGDLNTLADTYDMQGIGGGGGWQGPGQGGQFPGPVGPGGGAGQVSPPAWARGTFYGRDRNGRYLTMSITANGAVTLNTGGQMSTGSYLRSNNMTINGVMYRAVQQGNNIVVTNLAAGESVNYSRTGGPGWGGGQPGWGGGQQGNVPSWAVGTWYGTNPQTGGGWALTINTNGTVVYSFDSGATQQGSIYGDRLTILGVEYRISRISNGIRTTHVNNGSRLDFFNRRR